MPAREMLPFGEEVLERMVRAVELVRLRLQKATAALGAASVPYAVIGGNAVAYWVSTVDKAATRNTPEVTILVRREDSDLARTALVAEGYTSHVIPGGMMFLDPHSSERYGVDLLFAQDKIRPDDLLPTPDVSESQAGQEFQVIRLEALVQMQLTSFRCEDRMLIRDLIDVGLVDATWPARFAPELTERLQQILNNPNA